MKAAVARVYVHIMKLLDEAVVYYRSWRLSEFFSLCVCAWFPQLLDASNRDISHTSVPFLPMFANDYFQQTSEQLVDAVLQPNSKFDEYITKIDAEIRNMNELKDAGHIAQTADMMDMISGTGLRS